MKKQTLKSIFCLLLAFCFIFAVGCGGGGETSEPTEESPAEATSQAQSEDSQNGDGDGTADYVRLIDATLGDYNDRTVSSKNLLRGLDYDTSREPHEDYPDRKNLLTDGNSPVSFSKTVWAGYHSTAREGLDIDFDLGEVKENILDFHADVLNLVSYGISICDSMTVYVAGEDKNYVEVGTAYAPADISSNEAHDFAVRLQGAVSARYIRFSFSKNSSVWLFVGEVEAYAYDSAYEDALEGGYIEMSEYYGFESLPTADGEIYWENTETDYNEKINLAKGLKPYIFAGEAISTEVATEWYNTKNTGMLTDGNKATNSSISDSRWFHITRGDSREIVFDLGKISAISGFTAGFLKDRQPGVSLPRFLRLAVSLDGKDWQTVYAFENPSSNKDSDILRIEENFKKAYKARYARISFFVNPHIYLDEVELFGKKNVSGAVAPVADSADDKNSLNGSYIMPEDFDGIHNIMLSYNCLPDDNLNHDEGGLITVEEYLPYVAYLDEQGNIKDTFFDAFLYLPYTRFNYSNIGRNADGWRFYVDDTFYEGRNMSALNEAVGNVKKELSKDDYKVAVYTSILYTWKTLEDGKTKNPFGDIDGDGRAEDFSNIADRKKAIKWIMDEEFNRFKAGKYENLTFNGFYWFEESIAFDDSNETELVRYASDYAHKLGVKLFWIPYYTASGYAEWEELGFDLACMQPNYMFNQTATSDVLYSNAEKTRLLGMCVEMELTDPTNRNNAARFEEYMIAGAKTGYMYAVKAYYQDGVPGAFSTACYSDDPSVRKLYDDLYLYAMEKFEIFESADIALPDGGGLTLSGEPGKAIEGKIELGEFASYADSLIVAKSPRYGSVRLNHDGSFVYYPLKGYTGKDSFAVCIDLGYVTGAETTVEIEISA